VTRARHDQHMGTRWAYVQSVAASAKDTGKKVEAAASAVTLVVTGVAWWRYGVAWAWSSS
jgi:hypothetical protein